MRGNELLNSHPIRCYDDPSCPSDRYTVVFMDQLERTKDAKHSALYACYGFSGHSSAAIGKHLGKRVPFKSLPSHIQRIVKDDLCGDELVWWSSSSGRIEFQMTREQAGSVSQGGKDASEDVAALRKVKGFAEQLDAIKADVLADELREYGAWEDEQLADHDANLTRLVWIAGNDINEGQFDTEDSDG